MKRKTLVKTLIVDETGRVLMVRRSANDDILPGAWDFPGGNCNPGEDFAAATARETAEETGVTVRRPTLIYSCSKETEYGILTWLFYIDRLPARPAVRLSAEHDAYEWLTLDEMVQRAQWVHQELFAFIRGNNLLRADAPTFITARALLVDPAGQVVLLRRSPTDTFKPGAWDLPGGRIEAGEGIIEGARRETIEETGVTLSGPKLAFGISGKRPQGTGTWLFFVEHVPKGVTPQLSAEHDAYKRVPFARLPQYTDYEVLLRMHAFVTEHKLLA